MLFFDSTLRRYKETKSQLKEFHSELLRTIPKRELTTCAKSLGMYKKNKLYFPSNSCVDIFTDYLIYSWPAKGESPVDSFETDCPNKLHLLSGMQRNVFSLFGVEVIGNFRLKCRDLFREGLVEEIIDINMSHHPSPVFMFASRLLKFDDFCCFTGAGFPVFSNELLMDLMLDVSLFLEKNGVESVDDLSSKKETVFESIVIKWCIKHGAYKHYESKSL